MAVHLSVRTLIHHAHHVREGRQSCLCAQRHGIGQRTAQQGDQVLLTRCDGRQGGAWGYSWRGGHRIIGKRLDSAHKTIPTSIDRLNEMWRAPIITNGLPHRSESTLQCGVANMMTWPDLCTQLLSGDNAISMLQEIGEHA
jgi:hypothetical protein